MNGSPSGLPFLFLAWLLVLSFLVTFAVSVKSVSYHISKFVSRLILVVGCVAAFSSAALADNAKRPVATSKQKTVNAAATPMASSALNASIKAVAGRTKALVKNTPKVNAGNDTTGRDNRIVFSRASGDIFTTRIELATDEPLIEIGIYNMLGKRVMDVYKGASGRGQQDFSQSVAELPDGVYICILQGDNFRKAEKFYFRR